MKLYLGKAIGSQPPHIFAIADRMYRLLVAQGESQVRILLPPPWVMIGSQLDLIGLGCRGSSAAHGTIRHSRPLQPAQSRSGVTVTSESCTRGAYRALSLPFLPPPSNIHSPVCHHHTMTGMNAC